VKKIDEVVVVGYGTQKKTEVTSAISSVKEEDFNKGAITSSPIQLIQGKVAGLAVSRSNGGDPASGVQMQLRGVSTVSGTATPLVIIDGIPGGSLNTVAPEDIASIDVLRDGSAAAIYGTRGTNGVILITTKKGKAGKARIEYSGYSYFDEYSNKPSVLSGEDWRQLKIDFAHGTNVYLKGKVATMSDFGHNTDWFKEISQTKLSSVHNLSMSGGNEHIDYYAAVNYRDLNGLIKESYNNFINSRLKLGHTSANKKLRTDMSFSYTVQKYRPTDYSVFYKALQRNPTLPVYNPDGTFAEQTGFDNFNPVALLKQRDYEVQRSEILTNLRVTYELFKGLKFSTMLALQRSNQQEGQYLHRNSWQSITGGLKGEASRAERQSADRTYESTLDYHTAFGNNNNHELTALLGYTYQDFTNEGFGASNRDFISDDLSFNNLNAGQGLRNGLYRDRDVWSEKNTSTLAAFFGRLTYHIREKYIFS
ncbi:MAG: SusC/RagA family TonB-linked outer membrane protein, partial [Candidatus Nephrothrix sp. EaCA]